MPKQLMNEAERFLLEHWGEARLLEESMDDVRTKYKELFQRIIDAVTERHPELDAQRSIPTQFWDSGSVGFGKKVWPIDRYGSPSGLWVDGLRLENLAAEDSPPPHAYIWVPKKINLDLNSARVVLNAAAKDLLSADEQARAGNADSDDTLLYFPAPSKTELRHLLCEGDGQGFVARFVSQFGMMARFVPVLDRVFQECLQKDS